MQTIQIILLRVSSTEEGEQDISTQLPKLKEKFLNIREDASVLEEKGSAYDIDKLKDRHAFLQFLDKAFNANTVTIKDLFLRNYQTQPIELFVWDFARIMRNIEFNLLLNLLFQWFDVKVYSYKQGVIEIPPEERPFEKCLRYIKNALLSWEAEEYSHNISQNVKKSIVPGVTGARSNKGNKWGTQFTNADGEIVRLSQEEEARVKEMIVQQAKRHEKRQDFGYYPQIIEKVRQDFGIVVSKSYITKLTKG